MQVYKTTNLVNGKIYIGQDSRDNPRYFGSGFILKKAIKKYGIENFHKDILSICCNKHTLNWLEVFWISVYDSTNPKIGYNISRGGESFMYGRKHSEETKRKLSTMMSGEENPMYGKHHTDEAKKKLSVYRTGRKQSRESIQKTAKANTGRKHKEESKIKIGLSNKGKRLGMKSSDETKQKLSIARSGEKNIMFGKHLSDETKRKISDAIKGKRLGVKLSDEIKQKMRHPHNMKKKEL